MQVRKYGPSVPKLFNPVPVRFDVDRKYEPFGVSCKVAAWDKANEFKRDYEAKKAGLLPPRSIRDAKSKTIQYHAEDYLSDLKARGRDGRKGKGAKQIRSRLERLIR